MRNIALAALAVILLASGSALAAEEQRFAAVSTTSPMVVWRIDSVTGTVSICSFREPAQATWQSAPIEESNPLLQLAPKHGLRLEPICSPWSR